MSETMQCAVINWHGVMVYLNIWLVERMGVRATETSVTSELSESQVRAKNSDTGQALFFRLPLDEKTAETGLSNKFHK